MLSQARMTSQRREDFLRWFGKSKIIDQTGNPRIVYHGTIRSFELFRSRKRNPELGFHFGSVSQAEWFATYDEEQGTLSGGNIRPVYLRIENPLRLPDIFVRGRESSEDAAHSLYRDGLIDKADRTKIYCASSASEAHARLVRIIEVIGHDGIVYENDQEGGTADSNEESYAVFWSHQIRSVFELDSRYLTSDWKNSLVSRSSQ